MIRRPPRSTRVRSSAASDVYKRQIDDLLRCRLGPAATDHGVVPLVLTREEVLGRAAVVRTKAAAVVPVRAREEPEVAAFAQESVPYAADEPAVNTRAAVG